MAISLFQAAVSTQLVQVQVIAIVGGEPYNPTSDPVSMAFIPATFPAVNPQNTDWHTAAWETDAGGAYWAGILVGPANGGLVLAAGAYAVWVRVTDNPAVPVLQGPTLNVT